MGLDLDSSAWTSNMGWPKVVGAPFVFGSQPLKMNRIEQLNKAKKTDGRTSAKNSEVVT